MSNNLLQDYQETKKKLDSISDSFCLAKWLQVTLHLQYGLNHSCHNPEVKTIPLRDLENSPDNLHNTPYKSKRRKEMLDGIKPKECNICWTIEDSPGAHFSDRIIKSNDEWAIDRFNEVLKSGYKHNINPTSVEVSFSTLCNLRCTYCLPTVSSSWMSELKKFGDYPTFSRHHKIKYLPKKILKYNSNKKNPYIQAFWKWWPSLYPDLKVFRITGGEPLLMEETFILLKYIEQHPNPNLSLAINTNLSIPTTKIKKMLRSLILIYKKNTIKSITLHVSLDSLGKQAEYIRYGLDINLFNKNLNYLLDNTKNIKINFVFMCTFSLLSLHHFREFLIYILDLKAKHSILNGLFFNKIILDVSILEEPLFMNINLATKSMVDIINSDLNFMLANSITHNKNFGFSDFEINKMKRLQSFAKHNNLSSAILKKIYMVDFFYFFSEHDIRKKTDFLKTFPDLKQFYLQSKTYSDEFKQQSISFSTK